MVTSVYGIQSGVLTLVKWQAKSLHLFSLGNQGSDIYNDKDIFVVKLCSLYSETCL